MPNKNYKNPLDDISLDPLTNPIDEVIEEAAAATPEEIAAAQHNTEEMRARDAALLAEQEAAAAQQATNVQAMPMALSGGLSPIVPRTSQFEQTPIGPSEEVPEDYVPEEVFRDRQMLESDIHRADQQALHQQQLAEQAAIEQQNARVLELQQQQLQAAESHQAKVAADQKIAEDLRKQREKALEDITNIDNEIREIRPNDIFQDGTTWQKIGAAIAIGLSGAGQILTGDAGPNKALQIINDNIKRDLDAQQANNDYKLAKSKRAMELISMRIDNVSQNITDRERMMNLEVMRNNIEQQKAAIESEQLRQRMLAQSQPDGSGGLTRAQIDLLPENQQKDIIRLPDGSYHKALPGTSKDVREFISEVQPAATGIKRAIELAEEYNRASTLYAPRQAAARRAAIESELSSVARQLGDYKITRDIIGDPQKLTNVRSAEMQKLRTMYNKLEQDALNEFRNVGIEVPDYKAINRRNMQKLIEANPNVIKNEEIAERILRKHNRWRELF